MYSLGLISLEWVEQLFSLSFLFLFGWRDIVTLFISKFDLLISLVFKLRNGCLKIPSFFLQFRLGCVLKHLKRAFQPFYLLKNWYNLWLLHHNNIILFCTIIVSFWQSPMAGPPISTSSNSSLNQEMKAICFLSESTATSMNPQPRVAIYGYLNWQMLESHLFKSYMHIPAGAAAG